MSQDRQIRRYNEYISDILPNTEYNMTDKSSITSYYIKNMLIRTRQMFKWEGLPETIPERMLELYLQTNGNCMITKIEEKLYAFTGGLGGEPDEYYRPTIYTIANPALKISKNIRIDEEGVLVLNDSLYMGLLPILEKYAAETTETDISLYLAAVNSRITALITAADDKTREAAEKYLSDILSGKLGVIAETAFLEGLKTQPYSHSSGNNSITQLIELKQYLKGSLLNEIGLNANYNMKREAISSAESQLNNDILRTLTDDMLQNRQEAAEKINALYNTDITVRLNGTWEQNLEEIEIQLDNLEENNTETETETIEKTDERGTEYDSET